MLEPASMEATIGGNFCYKPVDPEILLERERAFWRVAMEYRRAQNMDAEYDLIPSNMTLSPIMSESGFWYHGNLVGSKRDFPS